MSLRTRKICVCAALALFLLLKLFLNSRQIPANFPVSSIPYQFGAYASSLLDHGDYADCTSVPCIRASRMPVLPWVLAALGRLSRSARTVAFLKNILVSVLTAAVLLWFVDIHARLFPGSGAAWLLLLPLALAPPFARHASSIFYEEGLLAEFLVSWSLLFMAGVVVWAKRDRAEGAPVVLACLLFATVIYLTKDSMLFVLLGSLALGALWTVRFREPRTLAALVLSLAALLAWGVHNQVDSGRFSISTSFDGENLYRGFNQQSYEIYPYVNLDEVLRAPHQVDLVDGKSYVIGIPELGFGNEWEWNDYYKRLAVSWVESDPPTAIDFTLKKISNFFFSLYLNPFEGGLNRTFADLIHAWLIFGRLMQLELAAMLAALWLRKNAWSKALVAGVLVVNLAYAAPYLVCYNYERHINVYLALVATSLFMVCSALLDMRSLKS